MEDYNVADAPRALRHTPASLLRRALLALNRCADSVLNRRGVTVDQYSLLKLAAVAPGMTQRDLTKGLDSDPNTIAAMVSLLETKGLLRREVSAKDARARCVYLTPDGSQLLADLDLVSAEVWRTLDACFEGEEGAAAMKVLESVSVRLGELRTKPAEKSAAG